MPVPSALPKIEPNLELDSIFTSKLKCAQTCLRKYYWEYIRNFQPRSISWPFLVGSAVHRGVELWMKGRRPKQVLLKTEEFIKEYIKPYTIPDSQQSDLALHTLIVLGILKGYMRHYKEDRRKFKVSASEQSIEDILPVTKTPFVGTLDLILKGKSGLIIMDHKCLRSLSEGKANNLKQDKQVQLYMWLLSQYTGEPCEGMYLNQIRKPGIRQKKDETRFEFMDRVEALYVNEPDKYFRRDFIYYQQRQVDAVITDAQWWTLILESMYESMTDVDILNPLNWPRNDDACYPFGDSSHCSFVHLCQNRRDGNDPLDQRPFMQRIGHERGEILRKENT